MSAVPITLIGSFSFDTGGTTTGTFDGVAAFSGVGVGGGPIVGHPAHPIAPGGKPPGIWGGAPPYVDAGLPGQQPGGIWGPPGPWPTPPIHIPPQPPEPEVPPGTPPNEVIKSPEPGAWGTYTDASGAPYSAYRPAADEASPKG